MNYMAKFMGSSSTANLSPIKAYMKLTAVGIGDRLSLPEILGIGLARVLQTLFKSLVE
jgi:hypothetical protein